VIKQAACHDAGGAPNPAFASQNLAAAHRTAAAELWRGRTVCWCARAHPAIVRRDVAFTLAHRAVVASRRVGRYAPGRMNRAPRVSGRRVAIAVLTVGISVGLLGVWWMQRARPAPGAYVDVVALGGDDAVAVRRERSSERAFVEMIAGGRVRWQALVPRYAAGANGVGLAASADAVAVRVVRDGRAELFVLSARDAGKLGSLHLADDRPGTPTGQTLPAATTLFDRERSYELLGQEGAWTRVTAVNLAAGTIAWVRDLDGEPVREAYVVGDRVELFRNRNLVELATRDGALTHRVIGLGPAEIDNGALPLMAHDLVARRIIGGDLTGARMVRQGHQRIVHAPVPGVVLSIEETSMRVTGQVRWPADARPPAPHHLAADGTLWIVLPDRLIALDAESLQPRVGVGGTLPVLEKVELFRLIKPEEILDHPGL